MNVLHAGIFEDHVLGGDIVLAKGFEQNACRLRRFEYRSHVRDAGESAMQQRLLDTLDPGTDLLLIGKGEKFRPGTLAEARRRGVHVALWYGDMRPQPESWLLELLPHVDTFFLSSTGETLREYHRLGRPGRSAYFLNPSDPDLPPRYADTPRGTRPIVFTGSAYGFAGAERAAVVDYLAKRPDATLFGSAGRQKNSLRDRVRRRLGLGARVLPRVRGDEYIAAIRSARIGVGVSAFQNVSGYTSDRMTHYLTFGTFYLVWRFPGLERILEPGAEVAAFESIDELDRQVTRFLADDAEREVIAAAGQRRMLTEYNTANVTGMMLDVLRGGRSERFAWVDVIA